MGAGRADVRRINPVPSWRGKRLTDIATRKLWLRVAQTTLPISTCPGGEVRHQSFFNRASVYEGYA